MTISHLGTNENDIEFPLQFVVEATFHPEGTTRDWVEYD